MTQMDIASNLWPLVHNDTGHGGYYNDLDMLQVGQGDMNPAKDGNKRDVSCTEPLHAAPDDEVDSAHLHGIV